MSLELVDKVYLGVVESNDDPLKLGRVKARVIDIFDNIPVEHIPWCSPTKDIAGQQFSVPDLGKVVSVIFENGSIYTPIYTYAQHFNINLEEKLKQLPYDDYVSMTALQFDDQTQVYVNKSEGLKLDHMLNMINITDTNINLNLKDNSGTLNIGTEDANQQAILGNHFMDWMDELVDNLLGSKGGAFLGNMMSPVITSPPLIQCLSKYKALRDSKFLSHNVNLNDNGYVNKLDRININQTGDKWTSTKDTNTITTISDQNATSSSSLKTDTPNQKLTTNEGSNLSNIPELQTMPENTVNPDIESILGVLDTKKYDVYQGNNQLNIVGVRYQYQGMEYSNKFIDKLYCVWRDDNNVWRVKYWKCSTLAGTFTYVTQEDVNSGVPVEFLNKKMPLKKWCSYMQKEGLGILAPSQYINSYYIGEHAGAKALKVKDKQLVYRDKDFNSNTITFSTAPTLQSVGMHIHKGYAGGVNVNNWSLGSTVLSSASDLNAFFKLAETHKSLYGNVFTYTLITSRDIDNWKRINNITDDPSQEVSEDAKALRKKYGI